VHGKTGSREEEQVCPECACPGPDPGVAQAREGSGQTERPQPVPGNDGSAGLAGKVGKEISQLSAGSGPIGEPSALTELVGADSALDVMLGELDDHLLTVGVGRAQLIAAGPRGPAAVPVGSSGR
jgi:hypothetical protein